MRAFALALLVPAVCVAGEFNKSLKIGDPAPAWKDLPGTDGKKHSLADHADKDVVVVVFTCNSCACSEEYEDRIIAFAQKYKGRAALVAVNVNTIPDDRLDAMKKKAEKKKFTFPYLYDETQKIARDYGATYTPEFFVLTKDRKIAYMGAMDDRTKVDDVKERYLELAMDAVLKGEKPAKGETIAHGCLIRYKRTRD
ncbi:MAG TPA: thioredoxin family protein [Gemmataceae bacterium]|nr:thioredoxin family protein [Gemmataceae bacterium]